MVNQTKKNRLLIVDDETSNIMVLTHILSQDYTIYAAKNGQDAIEAALEHMPDLILLDILMPEMDGYDVIAALKNSEKARTIPVIFVTGLDGAQDEEKALALGAVDYISKPFSAANVKLRVQNQIKMLNYVNEMAESSLLDQLTCIPNRRSFDERLHLEWGRAARTTTPLSILLLDLDNFKNYNDTYGHMQGDVLLQSIAKIFAQELKRSMDFVARWGGEEFVVLLANTDWDMAWVIAERMRKAVEDAVIPLADGQTTKTTISIGLNVQIPTSGDLPHDFVHNADKALYAAKNAGRNRICRYDSLIKRP